MFRFLMPLAALALAGCQGAIAWITPANDLRYAFLDRNLATRITTLYDLGPVGTPTRALLAFAQQGVGLGSCVENQRSRSGRTEFRNTLRLHDFEGDELIAWSDRELARAMDTWFATQGGFTTNYETFIPQRTDGFGRNYFICFGGGPRVGKQDQLVLYVQPQFNTEIAALNVALAFDPTGRIRAAEIFGIGTSPTTVVAGGHAAGQHVLSTNLAGAILVNGLRVRDASGATFTARRPAGGDNRRLVGAVLK